jgi:hypothetical protein
MGQAISFLCKGYIEEVEGEKTLKKRNKYIQWQRRSAWCGTVNRLFPPRRCKPSVTVVR